MTTESDSFVLLYFASASSFTGKSSDSLPAPTKASQLFKTLEKKYPGIRRKVLDSSALTINLEYVDLDENPEQLIKAGDEVAIIPPVSSG